MDLAGSFPLLSLSLSLGLNKLLSQMRRCLDLWYSVWELTPKPRVFRKGVERG